MSPEALELLVYQALRKHGLSRSLCMESARVVRSAADVAAEDAAKGGAPLVHCPGCKQMAPAEQMHTRCALCAAYEIERVRQSALEDSDDAEDAAKYRAAVERARNVDALAQAYWAMGKDDPDNGVELIPWSDADEEERESTRQMVREMLVVLRLTLDAGGGK